MNKETERLIRLVNDLLVLTRADSGALNLHPVLIDLPALVQTRCEAFKSIAAQHQVPLKTIFSTDASKPNQLSVQADPDRIAQVIDNLLDNAIRYSPSGKDVVIDISLENDFVRCQVIDAGLGIPAKHLLFIFDRFYRVDPARNRNHGGSGLGLSIVRSLVQAQGGRISATSTEGQGTTMTFWLPTARA